LAGIIIKTHQNTALKNALIAFFLLLSVLYALPNIFGSDLAVQVSSAGDKLIAKSDLTHHFFRNACTKSRSLRFSQFSSC
jgi:hypothetical protein